MTVPSWDTTDVSRFAFEAADSMARETRQPSSRTQVDLRSNATRENGQWLMGGLSPEIAKETVELLEKHVWPQLRE